MRMELTKIPKIYAQKINDDMNDIKSVLRHFSFVCVYTKSGDVLLLLWFSVFMYIMRVAATAFHRKIVEYTSMSIKGTATKPNQHNSSPQRNIVKYVLENKPQVTDDDDDGNNDKSGNNDGCGNNVRDLSIIWN